MSYWNAFVGVLEINPTLKPDDDRVTGKLPALHFYQLALPAPTEPLWTEPGWNLHRPEDICIDSFQADRAPDHTYKTMNLAGVFVRERGLFMAPANKGRLITTAASPRCVTSSTIATGARAWRCRTGRKTTSSST